MQQWRALVSTWNEAGRRLQLALGMIVGSHTLGAWRSWVFAVRAMARAEDAAKEQRLGQVMSEALESMVVAVSCPFI
jgi:hypothetical protein